MPIEEKALEEIEDAVKESAGYAGTWLSIGWDWIRVILLTLVKIPRRLITGGQDG